MTNKYIPLQAFAFIGFVLQLPIIYTFIRLKNVAVGCVASWLALLCLNIFLSIQLWHTPFINTWWDGKVYCDIVVRLLAGAHIGVICATIAISRNLALAAQPRCNNDFNSFKSRLIDLLICMLFPVLNMMWVILIQLPRYVVAQYEGCSLSVIAAWPDVPFYILPVVASLIATVFVGMVIIRLMKIRHMARDVLRNSGSNMSLRQFLRLLGFCVIVAGIILPLSLYDAVFNLKSLAKLIGTYHFPLLIEGWSEPTLFPNETLDPTTYAFVVLSYVSFLVYGFSEQVKLTYGRVFRLLDISRCVTRPRGRWLGGRGRLSKQSRCDDPEMFYQEDEINKYTNTVGGWSETRTSILVNGIDQKTWSPGQLTVVEQFELEDHQQISRCKAR